MRKPWKVLGAAVLAAVLLSGCGDGQSAITLSGQPVDSAGNSQGGQGEQGQGGQSEQGQGGQGQGGQSRSDGRITLTLGVLGESTVPKWKYLVDSYNAQSREYYVEIVEFLSDNYDGSTFEEAEDRFRMDFATGRGTDIILFGGISADEMGYAGVALDLKPFLTDSGEKYLWNILECAQTGDALYEISPAFTLSFIVGDGARLGMENGWTTEEMIESFERNGRDGLALARGQGRTVERLVEASIEDYVDWDTGTADFHKEEFYNVLEFGKETDHSDWISPTRESVVSGTHLASCAGLFTTADIQYFRWLFGDDAVVKGWPCSHGTGVAVDIGEGSLGICSYSRCPEGAWDFLEFYADGAWTEEEYDAGGERAEGRFSYYFPGFPVNRDLFEKVLEESMVQKYYPDTGKPIPLLQGEDDRPDFYANTAEDVEKLREVIALADRRYLYAQSVICRIIGEEIGGYNAGDLTAEQTAEKIQNRVQLYLDERK